MTNSSPNDQADNSYTSDALEAARRGDWPVAQQAARRLLTLTPASWSGWHLLSLAAAAMMSIPPLQPFQRATWLDPGRHDLWGALAAALEGLKLRQASVRASRRSLVLAPFVAETITNLGISLNAIWHVDAAGRWLERAGAIDPGNPIILNNRALIHLAAGRETRASVLLHEAVASAPGYAAARLNLAIVERRCGRPAVALRSITGAIQILPADSDSLAELGTVLVTIGEARAGTSWLRRALVAQPDNDKAMNSLLASLCYASDVSEIERQSAYAAAVAQSEMDNTTPPRQRLYVGSRGGRVTVGYVSPNFRAHPMTDQLAGLLSHHRRDRIRTIAYADISRPDAATDRLVGLVEAVRNTANLSDPTVAEMIAGDGVDVLVFLALHEEGSRRTLPGFRAAPVQVSLHDIATSGLSSIDAWITDSTLHPPDTSEWFSEALVRIPCLFLFSKLSDEPSLQLPPSAGPIVFASFNNPAKLSAPTLSTWAAILKRIPESTLFLRYGTLFGDSAVAGRVQQAFARHSIGADRLRLSTGSFSRADHLREIGAADIVLDPFPYNGNTATIEALWMGVPVISLKGARFLGRMSADILEKIGHEDCVATDMAAYVDNAVALALDRERRHRLRRSLRDDIRRSVLFDASTYARSMEDALFELARQKQSTAST